MIPVPSAGLAPAPWPDGVIARYITVGGALVDIEIEDADPGRREYVPRCRGCNGAAAGDLTDKQTACEWAQSHAERCRALPRPGSAS